MRWRIEEEIELEVFFAFGEEDTFLKVEDIYRFHKFISRDVFLNMMLDVDYELIKVENERGQVFATYRFEGPEDHLDVVLIGNFDWHGKSWNKEYITVRFVENRGEKKGVKREFGSEAMEMRNGLMEVYERVL